jgi:tetratricopeptide (TPR) repeat protein
MGTPGNSSDQGKTANLVVVGVICLAVGLGIGYYFGKTLGSASMPVAAANPAEPPPGAPVMDPAKFMADEASFKAMLKSNPGDVNTLVQLGNLYYDNNKFQEAVDTYGKALEIDPKNVNARTDRGSCYWSLGQADAAIGEFEKSLNVNPTHAQTLYNMGIVYLHGKNDMAGARKCWEKLLATNPDYPQRARIQQMLSSMSAPATPAAPNAEASKDQPKPGASKMEDLFNKMKK